MADAFNPSGQNLALTSAGATPLPLTRIQRGDQLRMHSVTEVFYKFGDENTLVATSGTNVGVRLPAGSVEVVGVPGTATHLVLAAAGAVDVNAAFGWGF